MNRSGVGSELEALSLVLKKFNFSHIIYTYLGMYPILTFEFLAEPFLPGVHFYDLNAVEDLIHKLDSHVAKLHCFCLKVFDHTRHYILESV